MGILSSLVNFLLRRGAETRLVEKPPAPADLPVTPPDTVKPEFKNSPPPSVEPMVPATPSPPPEPVPVAAPIRSLPQTMSLGCIDATITDDTCNQYISLLSEVTRVHPNNIKSGDDKLTLSRLDAQPDDIMTVSDVQEALRRTGFFPAVSSMAFLGIARAQLFDYFRNMSEVLKN